MVPLFIWFDLMLFSLSKIYMSYRILDSRNKYFDTLTLVKMLALLKSELIPCVDESLKNVKAKLPQNI